MGLEAATFVDDLVTTNPISTDKKKQGDDHLRLIKDVLKNSIKRVSRAFYVPSSVAKTANYSVVASDDNMNVLCDTSGGAFTLTLPTLAASDKGWCVYVLKTTTDANPVFVAPPSGTLNGFTKVRRSVPHVPTKVVWTGSVFSAQRANAAPIGACIEFYGATLPPGHLWPDGTTFTAADFVELNSVLGGNTKPDRRGRIAVCKDDIGGGGSANRITVAGCGIDGDVLGAVGGLETHALTEAEGPVHDHDVNITDPGHDHDILYETLSVDVTSPSQTAVRATGTSIGAGAVTRQDEITTTGITADALDAGSGTAHNNVQPSIVANFVLVAE